MNPTIFITPAGRAHFDARRILLAREIERQHVSLALPAYMIDGPDFTPSGSAQEAVQ